MKKKETISKTTKVWLGICSTLAFLCFLVLAITFVVGVVSLIVTRVTNNNAYNVFLFLMSLGIEVIYGLPIAGVGILFSIISFAIIRKNETKKIKLKGFKSINMISFVGCVLIPVIVFVFLFLLESSNVSLLSAVIK